MFDNIRVIAEPRYLSLAEEVADLERAVGTRFPIGYAEYVTIFGDGVLGGAYVRVYPPRRINNGPNSNREWRERIAEYWFWTDTAGVMTQQRALECVILGDTCDGDELVIHRSDPDLIYVLPRHRDDVLIAGRGLAEAIEWLCGSGVLTEAFPERDFDPFDTSVK